jgi:hypothetical protein
MHKKNIRFGRKICREELVSNVGTGSGILVRELIGIVESELVVRIGGAGTSSLMGRSTANGRRQWMIRNLVSA